jgi:hypothetical protein
MIARRAKTISDKVIAAALWASAAYIALHVAWLRELLAIWFGLSLPVLALGIFYWVFAEQRSRLAVPALAVRPARPVLVLRSSDLGSSVRPS